MPRLTPTQLLENIREENAERAQVLEALANAIAEQLQATNGILAVIATDAGRIAQALQPPAPNYRHPLAAYTAFDWPSIGAEAFDKDKDGVTAVLWNGYQWKRRSGTGRFGKSIWFSRTDGKTAEGEPNYIRLITFKDLAAAERLTFEQPDNGNGTQNDRHPDPAATAHLQYGDGSPVPINEESAIVFNAFCYAHQRKPESAEELRAWHEQQEVENK
jgi:hypothetical protein